jgi:hypothetical protein
MEINQGINCNEHPQKSKLNWIQFGIDQRWMNGKTRALKNI